MMIDSDWLVTVSEKHVIEQKNRCYKAIKTNETNKLGSLVYNEILGLLTCLPCPPLWPHTAFKDLGVKVNKGVACQLFITLCESSLFMFIHVKTMHTTRSLSQPLADLLLLQRLQPGYLEAELAKKC